MPGRRSFRVASALSLSFALAALAACQSAAPRPDAATAAHAPAGSAMTDPRAHGRFVSRELSLADGVIHRYQVFIPSRAAGGETPPLILFVHGSGERGDDNRKQVEVGLAPAIRERLDRFPAIVAFPQMHKDKADKHRFNLTALAILDAVQAEFGGDRARTYMTGLSMGGFASFDLALMQPQRFAAVVPVCGGFDAPKAADRERVEQLGGLWSLDDAAQRMKGQPFWIFHGAQDDVVPPQRSREMVAALERAGAPVRYTEFPEADHNAWDAAYASEELWTWLFAQRRPDAASASAGR